MVYPHNSDSYEPVELGASIFVEANKHLFRAVQEFNLSLTSFGEDDGELGIWDGSRFQFRVNLFPSTIITQTQPSYRSPKRMDPTAGGICLDSSYAMV